MLSFSIDVICDTPACGAQLAVAPMRVPNVYEALFQARQQGWEWVWAPGGEAAGGEVSGVCEGECRWIGKR